MSSIDKLPTLAALKRNEKLQEANGDQMNDFMHKQAAGEKPDPAQFLKMVERQMTLHAVAQAQLKLHEKTLRNAINSAR